MRSSGVAAFAGLAPAGRALGRAGIFASAPSFAAPESRPADCRHDHVATPPPTNSSKASTSQMVVSFFTLRKGTGRAASFCSGEGDALFLKLLLESGVTFAVADEHRRD